MRTFSSISEASLIKQGLCLSILPSGRYGASAGVRKSDASEPRELNMSTRQSCVLNVLAAVRQASGSCAAKGARRRGVSARALAALRAAARAWSSAAPCVALCVAPALGPIALRSITLSSSRQISERSSAAASSEFGFLILQKKSERTCLRLSSDPWKRVVRSFIADSTASPSCRSCSRASVASEPRATSEMALRGSLGWLSTINERVSVMSKSRFSEESSSTSLSSTAASSQPLRALWIFATHSTLRESSRDSCVR